MEFSQISLIQSQIFIFQLKTFKFKHQHKKQKFDQKRLQDSEVVDDEDADELPLGMGRVDFKDVYFHYKPERQILKGVTFTVEPGQSLALVCIIFML